MCPNVNFQIPICTTWYICNLKAHIYMVACCCVSACDVLNSNLDWSCHRKYHIRKVFPSACLHTTISKIECDWHWNNKFYIWRAFLLSVSACELQLCQDYWDGYHKVHVYMVSVLQHVAFHVITNFTFAGVSIRMWIFWFPLLLELLSQISHLWGFIELSGVQGTSSKD